MIRQPICVFMGHVDHGKTSLQDYIRNTYIAKNEAGAITQVISASKITTEKLKSICGDLLKNINLTIPGILFIDTPGHAAFTNLRKRGGNLADIAVLVIDINEGLKPQTKESIEVLKHYKTPFVVALNKVDRIKGWTQRTKYVLQDLEQQSEEVKREFDERFYKILGELYELGFESDRFDRIDDFTKKLALVPTSALSGEGVPELLMILSGLAQKFLEQNLDINLDSPGKATVLEVREEKGLGQTIHAILYDGKIETGDTIVIGHTIKPIVTKIRGLFELSNIKNSITKTYAADGIVILAPGIKDVMSGMPLAVTSKENLEQTEIEIQKEVEEVTIETDESGIVVKAESLGSLEALLSLLADYDIPVKRATLGSITKKDLTEAASEKEPYNQVILAFNISPPENNPENVKIISKDVIYKIIEEYDAWKKSEIERLKRESMESLKKPAKFTVLDGCIFRQSNPCIVGVKILGGTLKQNVPLIKADGSKAGELKSIQKDKETLPEAKRDDEVAVSIYGIICGRQIKERDVLYVDISELEFKELKRYKEYLSKEETEILKEFAEIKRKEKSLWGI